MKKYPLEIENWGSDRYMLISRGHHDIETFKNKCREEYSGMMRSLDNDAYPSPCEHAYYKAIPKDGYNSYYIPSSKNVRGSFPVTVWYE